MATLRQWSAVCRNVEDAYFSPSAEFIAASRAAFGCTHFARTFIAIASHLKLTSRHHLRYVVSCDSADYDDALKNSDTRKTINGHQFAIYKLNSNWHAIDATTGEIRCLPKTFSPESVNLNNVPVRFDNYPNSSLLLRAVGSDIQDDCGDDSFDSLMNISRSGNSRESTFRWPEYHA